MVFSFSHSLLLDTNSTSDGHYSYCKPLAYMPKQKKCAFGLLELKYLDHIISKDGLKADSSKCKAIQEWPQPTNLGEI